MKTIFKDKNGEPIYVLGLQSHNSSNGSWEMIEKSIEAVKLYHGNTLEVPVYWHQIEPKENQFDMSVVEELIRRVRKSGLFLVILWFGFSKNAGNTYLPDWTKEDTKKYWLASGPDGCPVPIISPHCDAIYDADAKAFKKLMECIRRVDEKDRTVISVQVENEIGLFFIDRCYSKEAEAAFEKGVPSALYDVTLENSEAKNEDQSWHGHFGRHAHEAFTSWYLGIGVEKIASAGKEAYPDLPLYMNTMQGEVRQKIAGHSYSSGAPVGRVLDIWRKAAPSISLFAPDIYRQHKSAFMLACETYSRNDNIFFVPETGTMGDAFASNLIHAAVDYNAVGICGFGAESTLGADGTLKDESKKVAATMNILQDMSPVLLKYLGSKQLFCVTQEEFQDLEHVEREKYHITFIFDNIRQSSEVMGGEYGGRTYGRSLRIGQEAMKDPASFIQRGRAVVYEASPYEYYMAGVGVAARFLKRTEPTDPCPYITNESRAATEVAALTIEEGHFTKNGEWICEFQRRGDELNPGVLLYPGTVLRVKMNPNIDCAGTLYNERK